MSLNGIKKRYHQADFEIYKHIQNIFINAVNQKCYVDSFSILRGGLSGWMTWQFLNILELFSP